MNDTADTASADEVRGFPAFPAQRSGRTFAATRWGRAWITALEDTALDGRQLRTARAFAKAGRLGPITVSAGLLTTTAEDEDGAHAVRVAVERLDTGEWSRLAEEAAARSGFTAALLAGELPAGLVDAAEDIGIPMLPGIGDLEPECGCDVWELPCRHAAALCYQFAWLVDREPLLLLLLRGATAELLLGPAAPEPAHPLDALPDGPGVPADRIRTLAAAAAEAARNLLAGRIDHEGA